MEVWTKRGLADAKAVEKMKNEIEEVKEENRKFICESESRVKEYIKEQNQSVTNLLEEIRNESVCIRECVSKIAAGEEKIASEIKQLTNETKEITALIATNGEKIDKTICNQTGMAVSQIEEEVLSVNQSVINLWKMVKILFVDSVITEIDKDVNDSASVKKLDNSINKSASSKILDNITNNTSIKYLQSLLTMGYSNEEASKICEQSLGYSDKKSEADKGKIQGKSKSQSTVFGKADNRKKISTSDRDIINQKISNRDKLLYDCWLYVKSNHSNMVYYSLREMGIDSKGANVLSDYIMWKYRSNGNNLYKMNAVEFWNYIMYEFDNDNKE